MISHLRSQLMLVLGTLGLCCIGYPLVLLLLGWGLFPNQATGSLVTDAQGTVVGSRLIAQQFQGDEWFQPRPSAVDYNAAGSGGSNLGANNPKLRERVEGSLKALPATGNVPADAVTASGSGLDPHITLANAQLQAQRVAGKRNIDVKQLSTLLDEMKVAVPLTQVYLIPVLELNLQLSQRFPITSPNTR